MANPTRPLAIVAEEVPPRTKATSYPEPFASRMAGRRKHPLGDLFGLTNFGVNLTRLAPGAVSALRHSHTRQDEFFYVLQDALTLQNRRRIIDFANQKRLPSMYVGKEWVEEGGLMCYGDRLPERYRRAASYVDKILRGAQPADLPV